MVQGQYLYIDLANFKKYHKFTPSVFINVY